METTILWDSRLRGSRFRGLGFRAQGVKGVKGLGFRYSLF